MGIAAYTISQALVLRATKEGNEQSAPSEGRQSTALFFVCGIIEFHRARMVKLVDTLP